MYFFHTFQVKIKGVNILNIKGDEPKTNQIIELTRSKILLKTEQKNRLCYKLDTYDTLADRQHYELHKKYNDDDKKKFFISTKDDKFFELSINPWNRFKLNIIHNRYLLVREKDHFLKILISTILGFIFGLVGLYIGYKLGLSKH